METPTKPDELSEIITRAGGVNAVARECGIKHPAVCQWVAGSRPVPLWHAQTIARMARRPVADMLPYITKKARTVEVA